jgi:hypothetical protein
MPREIGNFFSEKLLYLPFRAYFWNNLINDFLIFQISKATKDILIEVTSSVSLDTCKKVLDQLLQLMLEMGVGRAKPQSQAETEGQDEATGGQPKLHVPEKLIVEQVRILNFEGNMKDVYPSRTDLQNDAFEVCRDYE